MKLLLCLTIIPQYYKMGTHFYTSGFVNGMRKVTAVEVALQRPNGNDEFGVLDLFFDLRVSERAHIDLEG